jgi:hypothetical protein
MPDIDHLFHYGSDCFKDSLTEIMEMDGKDAELIQQVRQSDRIGSFCLVSIGIFIVPEILVLYASFRYI